MGFSDWKLRRKAAVIFATVMIVTTVMVGAREVTKATDDINSNYFGQIDADVQTVMRNVNEKIEFAKGLVRSIATLEFTIDLLGENSTEANLAKSAMATYLSSWEELEGIGLFHATVLNATGYEVIRTNYRFVAGMYRSFLVDEGELQDKSNETYFVTAANISEGEASISEIHLNRENGEIELSFGKPIPTIRFTTPIFDKENRIGAATVTLYADLLFAEAFTTFRRLNGNFSMIDDQGYFLYDNRTPWTGVSDFATNHTVWERFPSFELPEGNSSRLNMRPTVVLAYQTGIEVEGGKQYFFLLELDVSPLIDQVRANVRQLVIIVVAELSIIGFLLYAGVGRVILGAVTDLASTAEEASKGILRRQETLPTRLDEIGQLQRAFTSLTQFLITVVEEEKDLVEKIRTKSDNLSSIVEEISASSEEMNSTAQSMAHGAISQSDQLGGILSALGNAMERVNAVGNEIRQTTKVISDVALQTNILALNAGIEASRAGDYGRGFSVVAENIRKLATETQIQVEQITQTSEKIASSLEEVFAEIRHQVENVASVSEETSASAEEVVAAIEEISASLQSILDDVEDLQKDAVKSEETLNQFKIE